MKSSTSAGLEPIEPIYSAAPSAPPSRELLMDDMLNKTRRPGAPIRSSFVQQPPGSDSRVGPLAQFRRASYLDAFLFIHSLASAKEPFEASYPATSWARALGLSESSGSGVDDTATATSQWSKIGAKLKSLQLVDRVRSKHRTRWLLLDESGNGERYIRPRGNDGTWFTLPYEYWRDGYFQTLSFPAKVMLLIAMHSKPDFILPLERVEEWYGISRSTAQRGFAELQRAGLITFEQKWRLDATSATGYREARLYRLLGPFDQTAMRGRMLITPKKSSPPIFVDEQEAGPDDD